MILRGFLLISQGFATSTTMRVGELIENRKDISMTNEAEQNINKTHRNDLDDPSLCLLKSSPENKL